MFTGLQGPRGLTPNGKKQQQSGRVGLRSTLHVSIWSPFDGPHDGSPGTVWTTGARRSSVWFTISKQCRWREGRAGDRGPPCPLPLSSPMTSNGASSPATPGSGGCCRCRVPSMAPLLASRAGRRHPPSAAAGSRPRSCGLVRVDRSGRSPTAAGGRLREPHPGKPPSDRPGRRGRQRPDDDTCDVRPLPFSRGEIELSLTSGGAPGSDGRWRRHAHARRHRRPAAQWACRTQA